MPVDALEHEIEFLYASGKFQAAADLLSEHLREEPRDVAAHRLLAKVRMAQGRRDWGISLLRRAKILEQEQLAGGQSELAADDLSFVLQKEHEVLEASSDPVAWAQPNHTAEIANPALSREVEPMPAEARLTGSYGNAPLPARARGKSSSTGEDSPGPRIVYRRRRSFTRDSDGEAVDSVSGLQQQPKSPAPDDEELDLPEDYPGSQVLDEDLLELDWAAGDIAPEAWSSEGHESDADEWESASPDLGVTDPQTDDDGVDWSALDALFGAEEVEDIYAEENQPEDAEPISHRVELWHYAEQKALELIRSADLLERVRQAREAVRLFSEILFEGCLETGQPAASIRAKLPRLRRLLEQDATLDEIRSAYECRKVWAEHPELHITRGGAPSSTPWAGKEDARRVFFWNAALQMARYFRLSDADEFRAVFFALFERWSDSRRLQKIFPLFRSYVHFRLLQSGPELDGMPLWTFDAPDGVDPVVAIESDPVLGAAFRRALDDHGVVPELRRTRLDLPGADRIREKEQEERLANE